MILGSFVAKKPASYGCIGMAAFLSAILFIRYRAKEIFELDLDHNTYRKSYALLGLPSGSWRKLPEVQAVMVKQFSQYQASGTYAADAPATYHIVMLSVVNSRVGIIVQKYPDDEESAAQAVAQELAHYLAVPLRYSS
jgi:hypothetical protein